MGDFTRHVQHEEQKDKERENESESVIIHEVHEIVDKKNINVPPNIKDLSLHLNSI